jgi:membrane associated rhomboid family serine protease
VAVVPLSDSSRTPARPPLVTILIIGANAVCFVLELALGEQFVTRWSVIPAQVAAGHRWITLLSAMFMHASWSHIIGNMIFLWAFGPAIEDAMGSVRYLVFYMLGGLVAMVAQVITISQSTVPCLGASGAIAAVMGVFLVTYPTDRIKSILLIGFYARITLIPAAALIAIWFALQLVELGTVTASNTGGVAYLAHIGGVVFGAVFGRLFEKPRRIFQ